ncbi:MAG: L-rhamnose isomerase [Treponema sp.]|jgi:L-rhamnose isomerase|nr:L-rhamnose isomerase [Treponema sp.]
MNPYLNLDNINQTYALAKPAYAAFGVNADKAIKAALDIPISIQCWQGDDVTGFEGNEELTGGEIPATGKYPGKAANGNELRSDAEFIFALIPGKKRFNLHAIYAETGGHKVPRDEIEPEHFVHWMDWSKRKKIPLDFSPSFFSHPLADTGYTLSSPDAKIRDFWIRHGKASRKIASALGANQGSPAVSNIWVCDGCRNDPADRLSPRLRLRDALDDIFSEQCKEGTITDTLEPKLFGKGSEAYVPGSHEFFLGYASSKQMRLCLSTGHFHPTESIADKITAILLYVPGLLIHFSRGLRWDSDHVAVFSDEIRDVCHEIARQKYFNRIDIALDYFDASINRIAAWVIGARSVRKALLESLLEPVKLITDVETDSRNHERLALMEEFKTLPFSAVWDKLCLDAGVPPGAQWIEQANKYEKDVLLKRKAFTY